MANLYSDLDLTFGTDPEVFASYEKNGLDYVEPPAFFRYELKVPHKPDKKHPIFIERDNIVIMEDGAAFEYTVPPTKGSKSFFDNISLANRMLSDWLGKYNYKIYKKPVINYEVDKFINKPEEYQLALIFGCDPDEDAIEVGYQCTTIDAKLHPFRYGGGHFHIGSFDSEISEFIKFYHRPFIQLLAITVGTIVVAHSKYPDLERQRALLYGRPGRFRNDKPWGIEYRTPSNSWIDNSNTINDMLYRARLAFNFLQNPIKGKKLIADRLDSAVQAIRTADKTLAIATASQIESYL